MSGSGVIDSGNKDNRERWAALDSRLERLALTSDRQQSGSDAKDRDRDLKAAS